ncbi:uncharacterized protein LOC129245165 [Anastrepha obliqua]|uniref:uncharacterized protein LOC129245165 n=1 Tax=Anastrepha obliqua TaxID=95512 RepID=UPI00240A384A|nr:uncharacterized protein LOC129245165 [Anastrepha obliqua]
MEEAEQEKDIDYFHPIRMNTLGIPQEHDLLLAYDVYRPALETRALKSESGRTMYAEYFIEDIKLGPLRDLCTRALSLAYTPDQVLLGDDPLKIRLYYDSLSLDLPLEESYNITDEKYWRRFVLTKNKDVTLAFKKEYNWRSLGLSMKFVELVEACPAEYWPEDEMQPIAMHIKDHVEEMHIRSLQSVSERFFKERVHLDESDESESDSTDVESMTATPRSIQTSWDEMGEEEGEKERSTIQQYDEEEREVEIEKSEAEKEWDRLHQDILEERSERTRILREAQEKRRAERAERAEKRQAQELLKAKAMSQVEEPIPGKKKKPFRPKGVLDIQVEEPEDDGEDLINDRRNLERALKMIKLVDYPMRLCHHINLGFLRFFENLVNFTIEFCGPDMQRDFHERHLKFSYVDMQNLAFGISFLQKLKIFRLRSSQMDGQKLYIISKALKCLQSIEIIDFGYDHLEDDCGLGLYELFRHTKSIKSLELEHNLIGQRAMHFLAIGISRYGGQLEYVGLDGNLLGDEGLHELSSKILGTQHIARLRLRIAQLTESAIICCIANELLKHPPLQYLDIRTVPISRVAGVEILKVLQFNQTLMHFDVRDCQLDPDLGLDIVLIMKRNQYIAENPYLNDPTLSADKIDEFVNRIKNPLLLRATDAVKKRAECLKNRPPEFIPNFDLLQDEQNPDNAAESITSLDKLIPKTQPDSEQEKLSITLTDGSNILRPTPFVYDPTTFTEEEFHEHVFLPGPAERYYYYNLSRKQQISTGAETTP